MGNHTKGGNEKQHDTSEKNFKIKQETNKTKKIKEMKVIHHNIA